MSVLTLESVEIKPTEVVPQPLPPSFAIPIVFPFDEAIERLNYHFQSGIGLQLSFFEDNQIPQRFDLICVSANSPHLLYLPDRPMAEIFSVRRELEEKIRLRSNYQDGRPIPTKKVTEELVLANPQHNHYGERLVDIVQVQPTTNHTPWRLWREHISRALSN